MVDLQEATTVTKEDLARWWKIQDEMSKLKAEEAMLRARIFRHYFTNPTEGTNRHPLDDGYSLKGTHVINRKVLEPELEKLKEAIKAEGSNLPKLPLNKLVKWKPELVKSEYNKLTAEEQKVFDQALEIKPGTPQLEIDKPKRG
jgi:hypothetical protein